MPNRVETEAQRINEAVVASLHAAVRHLPTLAQNRATATAHAVVTSNVFYEDGNDDQPPVVYVEHWKAGMPAGSAPV